MSATPNTVAHVDLDRYLGTWFELCRLPLKWEPDGARDVTATYSLNDDGTIRVDNRCLDEDGKPTQALGQAKPVDDSNARLTVSFLPEYLRWIPFTKGDYWILRLAEDYSVSLVGTPDRKNLWLLARSRDLPQAVRDDYLATARAEGFDLSALITPAQSGKMVEIPPS
ncbi:membrane protein [Paracoccus acridae]|uniref:Outer membrane lipoprotein Blc n=1 Tax=Paracoccus acridae TaxID=1795310 RepID=A0ABQ1VJR5_9RHOB|nr:lipocalin family protein [Paracoccus acridae]GGF73147.1 membrane protein [Paracoccus acridae]